MEFSISRVICPFAGSSSIALLFLALFSSGCNGDDAVEYSDLPEITLIGVSQDTIRQYEDVLSIDIMYKDGNGDIGFEDPQEYALFVRDIRLEDFDGFYIGPVSPPGVEVPVQGDLNITFPSLFLFGNGDIELTRFEIKLYDRAGNESNLLETETVAIVRE